MASTVIGLRRALSLSSTLRSYSIVSSSTTNTTATYSFLHTPISPPPPPPLPLPQNPNAPGTSLFLPSRFSSSFNSLHRRNFHSTPPTLAVNRNFDDDKLDPDAILFEGCDYKHWLITMDFPKDPKPSPEEMVETYVQTLAKVVGSVEEAKKRMYACSTTTYTGFQAEVDEETSRKFEGMPGVVFVLPDSYIDPVNKEYGGDKYINGTIIPRPPPIQYGRQTRRGRNYEQHPRGPNQPYQGNQGYDQYRSAQGDRRDYAPQQNYPSEQNYLPPGQGERRNPMPNNMGPISGGRPPYQGDSYNQGSNGQGNYSQGNYNQGNHYPQHHRGYPMAGQRGNGFQEQGAHRGNAFQGQQEYTGQTQNFTPPPFQGSSSGQGEGYPMAGQRGNGFPEQGAYRGNSFQGQQEYTVQTQNFTPLPFQGSSSGQGEVRTHGQYRHGSYEQGGSDIYGQGGTPGYGTGYTAPRENSRFPKFSEENNVRGERNYAPMGETGMKEVTDKGAGK
ncbi:hypothetical protein Dimus_018054 [Dionaea muscipula]